MARTIAEVRAFLDSLIGLVTVDKSDGSLNGQCVSLIKNVLEFVGAPNPYVARGHAKDIPVTYVTQGIARTGNGNLNVAVNRYGGDGFGHVWIKIGSYTWQANMNGKPVKKNTYEDPITDIINLDQWITGGAPSPGDGGKATSTGPKGKALIKDFEKCVLTAYDNNDGMITIGWGHAEPKGNTNLVAGVTRWSQAQADSTFESDLKKYEKAVNDYFTRSFNQNQFDAMVSFTYNLGVGVFANDGWDRNASNEYILASLPKYINKGSAHEPGLVRRRNAEIALFNTPVSGGGSETDEGEIEMYLIYTVDTNNWYVSNGVQCRWVKTERALKNYKDEFGKLNLRIDNMYSTELYKEFPKDTIIVK